MPYLHYLGIDVGNEGNWYILLPYLGHKPAYHPPIHIPYKYYAQCVTAAGRYGYLRNSQRYLTQWKRMCMQFEWIGQFRQSTNLSEKILMANSPTSAPGMQGGAYRALIGTYATHCSATNDKELLQCICRAKQSYSSSLSSLGWSVPLAGWD